MLDNEQGETVSRRPITATVREWVQQCQGCQPHGEKMKEEEIQSTKFTLTTTAATGKRGLGIAEEQESDEYESLLTLQSTIGPGSNCRMHWRHSEENVQNQQNINNQ